MKNGADLEILELLLTKETVFHCDDDGLTATHWAIKLGEQAIFDHLFQKYNEKKFLDQTTKDKERLPLLHFAILSSSSQDMISELLEAGCSMEQKDAHARTALLFASLKQPELVPFLIEKGADEKAVDVKKNNLLHLCCVANGVIPDISTKLVKELANAFNADGFAVGHAVAREGLREVLKELEDKGFDKELKTKDGKTSAQLLEEFVQKEEKEIQEEVQKLVEKVSYVLLTIFD